MTQQVNLPLEDNLMQKIDSVPGTRRETIKKLVKNALTDPEVKKAFLLTGGKGTRLRPLTNKKPKPLIEVGGKPIAERVVEWLKRYGIEEVVFATGYKAGMIEGYFGDGSDYGMKFSYSKEEKPLGTGGCLRLAQDQLDETFLFVNGDLLLDFDLSKMIRNHYTNPGIITMALKGVEDPSRYGVAKLEGRRIYEFIEKPSNPESNLINAGVSLMEPDIFNYMKPGKCSLEDEMLPEVVEDELMYGHPIKGMWLDIGTLEALEEARKMIK